MCRSSPATLPLELFACIIDNVGHHPLGVSNMPPAQLENLKSCALTCTTLAPLCQAHIFKQINLADYRGDAEDAVGRLLRLVAVLTENPHLACHVRNFALDLLIVDNSRLSVTQLDQIQTVLLFFPKLQRLTFTGSPFTRTELPDRPESLGIHMMNTYVGQCTLDFIHIGHTMGNIPFNEILSSSQLRTLEVSSVTIPPVIFPTSSLTSLHFYSYDDFPLSFLSCFPFLESLEISNISSITTGPPDKRPPSFKLKNLVLRNWDIARFFDFYVSKSREAKTQPFPQLEVLRVLAYVEDDIRTIQSLKGLLPLLREFDLDASECSEVVFPLLSLELSEMCRGCTKISLSLAAEPFSLSYNRTMEEIIGLFTLMSRSNTLQTIRLSVSSEISDFNLPSMEHWSRFATVLAVRSDFPTLKLAEVLLFLAPFSATVNDGDIISEFEKDTQKGELVTHLTNAMVALSHRPEVRYNGRISIGY